MPASMWNYIRGFSVICVTGLSVEKFMNVAAVGGVIIWDVRPDGSRIEMKVPSGSEKRLKEYALKTGCRLEFLGEYGLPAILKKYSKRKGYAAGLTAFSLCLYIMSAFVWTVSVVGAERIDENDIIESCRQRGLAPGKLKNGLDLYAIGEELLLEYDDISWVSIDMKGTGVTVNIVETIPETEYVERERPMEVVASSGGVIESVAVSAGTALVKEGDEVKEGDVLISCSVALRDGEEIKGEKYVAASGEVRALQRYELEGRAALVYNEKVFTEKTKKDYSVNIGENNINVFSPPDMDGYDMLSSDSLVFKIGDYILPFGITETVYAKTETQRRQRTAEEALEAAGKRLDDKLTALLAETGGELREFSSAESVSGNEAMITGEALISVRIDEQKEADYIHHEEVIE